MIHAKRIILIILLGLLFVGIEALSAKQPPTSEPSKKAIIPPQAKPNIGQQAPAVPKEPIEKEPLKTAPEASNIIAGSNNVLEKSADKNDPDLWVMRFTGVLALFAALQFIAMLLQYRAMRGQSHDIHRSIELTREELEVAKASAGAAQKSADVAQKSTDTLIMTERAYILASLPDEVSIKTNETRTMIRVKITLFNYGRTPAILKGWTARLAMLEEPPSAQIVDTKRTVEFPGNVIVGADKDWSTYTNRGYTKVEWVQIEQVDCILYCYGTVQYDDVFGQSYETGFCWEYDQGNNRFYITDSKNMNYQKILST